MRGEGSSSAGPVWIPIWTDVGVNARQKHGRSETLALLEHETDVHETGGEPAFGRVLGLDHLLALLVHGLRAGRPVLQGGQEAIQVHPGLHCEHEPFGQPHGILLVLFIIFLPRHPRQRARPAPRGRNGSRAGDAFPKPVIVLSDPRPPRKSERARKSEGDPRAPSGSTELAARRRLGFSRPECR